MADVGEVRSRHRSLDDAAEIPGPRYDRSKVTPGIVHFGVGNFHRAHQAVYLDDLMNQGKALDWGISGVGVLPGDSRMRDALAPQDNLYTLTLRHPDGSLEPRVVGSIVEYLYAPDDHEAVIRRLADPSTRIVSLTVTEGGYNNHPVTGTFDTSNAAIREDARAEVPATVFGLVVAGLKRRREAGIAPFTILSCDNIQENGRVARSAFSEFARLTDPDLAEWIAREVAFPSSMVDRITPVTSDADRDLVRSRFGIDDQWPVLSEPFRQWAIEDDFPLGRPPLEDAGAQLVSDVMPYELMKLRLLNVGHQALAYFGYLAGYRFTHDAMADPLIARFVRAYMDLDATPTLLPVPGVDLDRYKDELIARFSNPEVKDTLARLCVDSSNRIPKWLTPVILHNLETGGEVSLSAAIVASWARYAEGVDENGEPIEVVDPHGDVIKERARAQTVDELAFLRAPDLFASVVDDPRFTDPYRTALRLMHTVGALETLRWSLSTNGRG